MTSVPISKFKARCLALLENVNKTGIPLRVTRFGKPIADIVPAQQPVEASWLGLMQGTGEILGDIVGPVAVEDEWDVLAAAPDKRGRELRAKRARKAPRR